MLAEEVCGRLGGVLQPILGGVQIHQNDISSCFTPNSFVMVNYEPVHLKH